MLIPSRPRPRIDLLLGWLILLGVLLVAGWFVWSTIPTMSHTLECRGIQGDYRAAELRGTREQRAELEVRFKQAGCTGSLLNTFLPAT